jgi:LacI family kdg operon repressor
MNSKISKPVNKKRISLFTEIQRGAGINLRQKKITINDLTRLTNVSKTTISRYLNGKYEYMSLETQNRIREAIALTRYQPNNIARSLKNNKSMLVGLVVADIESPFSSAIIKSAGDAMQETGYNVIVVNCDNKHENEKRYIRSLIGQQIDGLIVNTTVSTNPYLIGLANDGMPIVLIDRFVRDYNFDIAYIDCKKPVSEAMSHLQEMGYATISMFTEAPYEEISPRYLRREYFIEQLAALGLEKPERYVFAVEKYNGKNISNAIQELLQLNRKQAGPPAIIATNGVILMSIAKEILRLGLSMPGDIGLCGYDEWGSVSELGWAELLNVGLTTMRPPIHPLGEKAAEILMKRIRKVSSPKEQVVIPAPLYVQQSTRLRI